MAEFFPGENDVSRILTSNISGSIRVDSVRIIGAAEDACSGDCRPNIASTSEKLSGADDDDDANSVLFSTSAYSNENLIWKKYIILNWMPDSVFVYLCVYVWTFENFKYFSVGFKFYPQNSVSKLQLNSFYK